jgi:mono/diheme cytochrome c family protein
MLKTTTRFVVFAVLASAPLGAPTINASQPPPSPAAPPPASGSQGREAAPPPPSASQGRGRGATITSPRDAYPERAVADPAAIERGKALYTVNCAFCHGADTRGGDSGPSLLRSGLVLDDQHGELMAPVIQNGRTDRGMPKFSFTNEQIADIAAFIHTFRAAGYDESRRPPPSILVGDAKAGEAFFNGKCASCHSATGDLRGIASKIPDERLLQQTWLMPGSGGGRGGPPPVSVPAVTVTVTLPSGEKVEGTLDRIDDFVVSLTTSDGSHRSFRTSDRIKVEIHDPLQPHRELLRVYSDADIHNVTAYLVTLK